MPLGGFLRGVVERELIFLENHSLVKNKAHRWALKQLWVFVVYYQFIECKIC